MIALRVCAVLAMEELNEKGSPLHNALSTPSNSERSRKMLPQRLNEIIPFLIWYNLLRLVVPEKSLIHHVELLDEVGSLVFIFCFLPPCF